MSVIIKGMAKPNSCSACIFRHICDYSSDGDRYRKRPGLDVSDRCPFEEVTIEPDECLEYKGQKYVSATRIKKIIEDRELICNVCKGRKDNGEIH